MKKTFVLAAVAIGIFLNAHLASGEDLVRYREYTLGTSLAVVAETSRTAATEARTLHVRPAKIQQLKWRAPYPAPDAIGADPVRDVLFTFADDVLYQIVVTYERIRVEGLTDVDLIDVVSAAYGEPVLSKGSVARDVSPTLELPSDTVVLARWDTAVASVMLIRGTFSPALQLVLTSKPLYTSARAAIAEAVRLDTREAPQREIDERERHATAAEAAQVKARALNKPTFRP